MKKTILLLFALSVLTFGCADNSEDTIPDPVVPEINIDEGKSESTHDDGDKKVIKPRVRKSGFSS